MFASGTICDQRELTTGKYGRSGTQWSVAAYTVLADVALIIIQ